MPDYGMINNKQMERQKLPEEMHLYGGDIYDSLRLARYLLI